MTERLWKAIRTRASALERRLRGSGEADAAGAGAVEATAAAAEETPGADETAGPRTFVVGDIHGHLAKLRDLLSRLREVARPGDSLVFVGDYVDRGPESRGVVDLVLRLGDGEWDGPVIALRGNHEEMMLDYAAGSVEYEPEIWLQNGGTETLESYGGDLGSELLELLPEEHRVFLYGLELWHEDEHGIYVHAGLEPGLQPYETSEAVLLWTRDRFIDSDYRWEKVVVFGHTPQYEEPRSLFARRADLPWRPLNRPEKIGIDTGAAYGGPLSAVMLPERRFFSAP